MSTMLRSAVMSLLSKTLQTFLYKYLLDVDVEGVAMPSLMDVDGQSGWGVRLCNVRLREGVELMTFPGKRTVKKKRPANVTTTTGKEDSKALNENGEEVNQKNSSPPSRDDKVDKEELERVQVVHAKPADNEVLENAQQQVARSRLLTEDDTELDSAISSRAPSPTPLICRGSSASSVLGCLNRGSSTEVEKDRDVATLEKADEEEAEEEAEAYDLVKKNVVFDTKGVEKEEIKVEEVEAEPEPAKLHVDEEDEFIMSEQDMVLRLGVGGRIGTLDVRLMGKELHVTVEDAYLPVEASPQAEEEDDASRDTATTSDTTKDDSSRSKKEKRKAAPKPKKKTPAQTAGERVLENSDIARAISAMPHLFLRDCRVRLTIREKPVAKGPNDEGGETELTVDDSVVEMSIEMLSITSGEDFLAHVRTEGESTSSNTNATEPKDPKPKPSLKALEESNENEYLVKRIRTGRGPEGGISVKVFPPLKRRFDYSLPSMKDDKEWAIQHWNDRTQFCLFRCSGLDVISRLYLGKKKEVAMRNNDYAWYGDEYDEYTLDSMLYGVDYIATGPMPALPPLHKVQRTVSGQKAKGAKVEPDDYETDCNGIQSTKIPSCFHRVARGLQPTLSQRTHLPSENCPYCWEDLDRPNSYGKNPLDYSTPLPGVVLNISLLDPLEVNVDRLALEVLSDLTTLFTKKDTEKSSSNGVGEPDLLVDGGGSSSSRMGWSFRKPRKEKLNKAFPSYMQPETIEIVGLYLAKVVWRVHILSNDGRYDSGMKFRYLESAANCITVDYQKHKSKEKNFQDVRLDLGYFETNELGGIVQKRIMSVGQPIADVDDSDSVSAASSAASNAKKSKNRSPWPSTAAAMLKLRPSMESMDYESRERHGMQFRYISLASPLIPETAVKSTANVRVGRVNVAMSSAATSELSGIATEATNVLFKRDGRVEASKEDRPTASKAKPTAKSAEPSLIKYIVRIDGGGIRLDPNIRVALPELSFGGEQSSNSGLFLETVLQQVALEYGQRDAKSSSHRTMDLKHLAALPEKVRLRVLLFLKDLSPLEGALGAKREPNSFLRCRAVNRAIVRVAKKPRVGRRKKAKSFDAGHSSRRQELVREVLKLDDHTLASLLASHQANKVHKTKPVRKPHDSR